jgi:hypothetical protein
MDPDKAVIGKNFLILFQCFGSKQCFIIGKKKFGVITLAFQADYFVGMVKEGTLCGR